MVWGSSPRIPSVLAQRSEVMRQGIITYQWGSTGKRGNGTRYAQPTLNSTERNTLSTPSARPMFAESVPS